MSGRSPSAIVVAVATAVFAAVLLGAGPASGGVTPTTTCAPDDPYGCLGTTTTLAGGVIPGCSASASAAAAGTTVSVTITDVPDGLEVDLRFNGQVVASGTAGASAAEVEPAAAPGYDDLELVFRVPAVAPGTYGLEATGAAFQVECLAGEGFRVLGSNEARVDDGTGGPGGTRSSGGGSLARTGTTVFGLVLLAALLILVGRRLQRRAH